jgi:predicted GNAT superfamily acetyltransferase
MAFDIELVHDISAMTELSDFFAQVWANGPEVVPFDIGFAITHVGGYAALARSGQTVIGASFGVRGVYANQNILHSHVTASRVAGIGYQLKIHQFNWAKSNGLDAITWTFDPLVRRNCVFNLSKLGAVGVEFLPNFYGTMTDDINAGDESDRIFAFWSLAKAAEPKDATFTENIALADNDGQPKRNEFDPSQPFAIYLPEDIEALRKIDLDLVKAWRTEVHQLLSVAFNNGATVSQMVDNRKAILVAPKMKTK